MMFDEFTFAVWVGFLPAWLAWEIVTLVRRGHGVHVGTISMVAQRRGWQLSSAVFFWAAMPVHWWAPIRWASTAGTVVFWLLQLALLAWNVARWKRTARPLEEWPRWERWLSWPVWYLVAGPLAAALLFPQAGRLPWGP